MASTFQDEARRDPLTGLRNRRYVDEHLPALLDSGQSLTVGSWTWTTSNGSMTCSPTTPAIRC